MGLASVKGSPGVTVSAVALAMAWAAERDVVVCDFDVAGAEVAAWLELGASPNLSTLAAESRHGLEVEGLLGHTQRVGERLRVLAGAATLEEGVAALDVLWRVGLPATLRNAGAEMELLVDLGRAEPHTPAGRLVGELDELLVVLRPTWTQVRSVSSRIASWREMCRVRLLLVGDQPYRPAEIEDALAAPVAGVLADDAVAAGAVSGNAVLTRAWERSRLWRSAKTLAASLADERGADASSAGAVEEVA